MTGNSGNNGNNGTNGKGIVTRVSNSAGGDEDIEYLIDIVAIDDNHPTIDKVRSYVGQEHANYKLTNAKGFVLFGKVLYKTRCLFVPSLTHFFDTATDIALVWEWYLLYQNVTNIASISSLAKVAHSKPLGLTPNSHSLRSNPISPAMSASGVAFAGAAIGGHRRPGMHELNPSIVSQASTISTLSLNQNNLTLNSITNTFNNNTHNNHGRIGSHSHFVGRYNNDGLNRILKMSIAGNIKNAGFNFCDRNSLFYDTEIIITRSYIFL